MINIAIIDDDKTFCDDFEEQIKKIDNSYNTDCYYDINTFLESVSSYNIAIIDIMLGKDNGIDIASAITEKYPNIKIIFISVEQDFFQDVYSVNHLYFLVKPISNKQLKQALSVCCSEINKQTLYTKLGSGTTAVNLNDVSYFEGILKKTIVHYVNAPKQTLNEPLKDIEKEILNTNFIRIHQSYIVNLTYITQFTKTKVNIQDLEIPISRKYSQSALNGISKFLGNNLL